MDISSFKLEDIVNMLFQKISEMTNMIDISKIDFANITGIILTTLVIVFTSSVILWLLKSIGLYTIAKNRGDKYAFLAFIPYACLYTKGKIVGNTKLLGIEVEHPEYILPLLLIAMLFPFTSWLCTILFILFDLAILYRIYQLLIPNVAILMLILSIIFPIIIPFVLFFVRNKQIASTSTTK